MLANLENSTVATGLEKISFHSNPKERQCQRILNTNTYHRQSCPTLCDPMECSPLGSSVDGILQARILEWVAISFSRGCSQPRDWTQVSCTAGRCFNLWDTREAPLHIYVFVYVYIHHMYMYTASSLPILSMNTWIVFMSWLLYIMLQWTWECR